MTSLSPDHEDMAISDQNQAALVELMGVLFGDGAFETVAKMNPEGSDLSTSAKRKKHEKRQAQVGLAANVLGITAGAQALYSSSSALKGKLKSKPADEKVAPKHAKANKVPNIAGFKGRLKVADLAEKKGLLKNPKTGVYLAGGMVALQGANLAGDLVANRVLSREAKKDIRVKKSLGDYTPSGQVKQRVIAPDDGFSLGAKGQLVRLTLKNKDKIKPLVENGVETSKKVAVKGVEVGKPIAAKTKKAQEQFLAKADNMVIKGSISKSNADKRQVFGWASIVEKDGVPVVDLQGDYISVEEVEKAAYEYVQKSRKGGNMHKRNGDDPHHVSDMIESFVITPEKKEKLGMPETTPTGWWVGFQVHDEETWDQIKTGQRSAFSLHGRGKRQEV